MKKLIRYLLLLSFTATVGCSSDMSDLEYIPDNEIYGVWTDTTIIQTKGLRVEKLAIRSNSSFIYSIEGFGAYESQTLDDKSFTQEDFGSFVLSTRNIYFVSKQYQYWDFVSQKISETKIEDKVLFESCTYTIVNDTLTLKFKNIQADSKLDTTIKLTRL